MEKKGVKFFETSKRAYPEWLRNHAAFKELSKIDKIFPKIGLPNFSVPADFMNNQEAMADGMRLGNRIRNELANSQKSLYDALDKLLFLSQEKDRNDLCVKHQLAINIISAVSNSLSFGDYVAVADNKVILRLRSDIFSGNEKTPLFKKNEAVLRVAKKISNILTEIGIKFCDIEQLSEFKDFSKNNMPKKRYNVVFSSAGDDGAWDISTISMRGIASCQTWTAPQSRGLIGSVASKFVAVMYLASDTEIPGYGSKMLRRSLVRFCIDGRTKKPALLLDHMYPSDDKPTLDAFCKILKDKSGLDVIYAYTRPPGIENYYIPNEPVLKLLRQGESPYMDIPIPVKDHLPIKVGVDGRITELTDLFKLKICNQVNTQSIERKKLYIKAKEKYDADKATYESAKKKFDEEQQTKPENERSKFELESPKMDHELAEYGGGVTNLFKHCDKKHGANSAGSVFTSLILNSVKNIDNFEYLTKEEYHRKYLMSFLRDANNVKKEAWNQASKGTWMRSFPRSSERFFNYVFAKMKNIMLEECKKLIKKSN